MIFKKMGKKNKIEKKKIILAYFMAFFSVLLLTVLRIILKPILGEAAPMFLLTLAVICSASLGGFGPGAFATFLSVLAARFYFFIPVFNFSINSPRDQIRLLIFTMTGLFISWLFQKLHNSNYEQKHLQEELKRAKEIAEAANYTKSAFLANMSHEIRTPLSSIMGYAELLQDPDFPDADKKNYIQTILRNGRELTQIIDDILDLSKVESGRMKIERMQFSLPNLLSEVLSSLKVKADDKKIDLSLVVDPSLPTIIFSDPTRLRQILFNIIGNALKFTQKGKVQVEVALKELRQISFSIKDTGRGISEEEQKRLFQPFSQADTSTTRVFGGTGLGLILSRKMAEALGGGVFLQESTFGRGSTFVIFIESNMNTSLEGRQIVEASPIQEPNSPLSPLALKGTRFLLAEDSLDNQFLMQKILTKFGAEIDIAGNGQEVLLMVFKHNYDLILMDLQMPLLDGLQTTQELRRKGYQGPIIALTALAMKEEIEKALQAGCNAHIAKPINKENFVNFICAFLKRNCTVDKTAAN